MPNFKALREFIDSLTNSRIFSAGIMGATNQTQLQIEEIKKAYVLLRQKPESQSAKDNFISTLLAAHALSIITDKDLNNCQKWLENK